ncbi:hypothetical protein C5167_009848 [Papaver somniferum]|uniref:Uncharacterized protein n=1 Tax=Papaver somniferum TaxID=3469 RepID=A0A4Y7JZQ0_PAPSO|nr:hypothetical protein C5167_009848 [Papaver somniferum]
MDSVKTAEDVMYGLIPYYPMIESSRTDGARKDKD